MPLVFLDFPYLARKNLVGQMTNTDLVRVSLQSHTADMALKEFGKKDISFFDLDASEMYRLSEFDKAELFFREVARREALPEWPISLSGYVSKTSTLDFSNHKKKFSFSMKIESLKNMEHYSGVRKNLMIGDNYVPVVIIDNRECISFWNNKTTALISVLQYFGEKFGMTISCLSLCDDGSLNKSDSMRQIICCCSQMSFKDFSVGEETDNDDVKKITLSDDDYKFAMENLTVTGTFYAHSRTSEQFKFDGTIKAKSISIENGHWFNLQHLLASVDYEELTVKGKKFTTAELRTFMEKWVAGGFPNLKNLKLESEEVFYKATDGFEKRNDRQMGYPSRNLLSSHIKGSGGNYAIVWSPFGALGFNMEVDYEAL